VCNYAGGIYYSRFAYQSLPHPNPVRRICPTRTGRAAHSPFVRLSGGTEQAINTPWKLQNRQKLIPCHSLAHNAWLCLPPTRYAKTISISANSKNWSNHLTIREKSICWRTGQFANLSGSRRDTQAIQRIESGGSLGRHGSRTQAWHQPSGMSCNDRSCASKVTVDCQQCLQL